MNIFELFRGGANPNAVQANAKPLDPMNPENRGNPMNSQNQQPAAGNPPVKEEPKVEEKPPVVDYSKLWEPDPTQKGPADPAEFAFNIDPTKLAATFGSLDFSSAVTAETLAKIKAGGDDAVGAMIAAMNAIAQKSVQTAVMASTKVSENGIRSSGQRVKDYIPSVVRENQVSAALRADNPLMKDPQYAPIVEAVTMQMARQFPQATAEEVKDHTRKYFDNMVGNIAQSSGRQIIDAPKATDQRSYQTDWSTEPI
jgi:hypothetical protein